MANQMFKKPSDLWNGYSVKEIRNWSKEGEPSYKEMKKDISVWNKVATQLHKNNKEITENFNNLSVSTDNHILSFINGIYIQVKNKKINVDDINIINELDDGSRGLSKKMCMVLLNFDGDIIYESFEYCNKYYYM